MAVKLSTFLGTALDVGLNSDGVVQVVTGSGMAGLIPLDSNTAGDYVKTLGNSPNGGLIVVGSGAHAADVHIRVDSSSIATLSSTQTLTNKTINLTNNTLSMTLGQLNAAVSGANVASLDGVETLTSKTLTSPTINTPTIVGPGSITKISTFGLRDATTTTYNTFLASNNASPVLTADRTLTLDVNNANRTVSLSGNITLAGALTTSGGHDVILTTSGASSVTLPTSGTLVSKDGSGNVSVEGTITGELDRSVHTTVTAGTYGNATSVPIVTVDSNGFVDSIGTTTLTGVTSVDYNTSTGVISVAAPNGTFTDTVTLGPFTTSDLTEGSNLYFTTTRARNSINVVDAGGDGSFAYDSALGKLTYTGPSATEVRAHFTAGEGVTITNGVVAIAQAVDSSEDVVFGTVTTSGDVTVGGNLTVQGTTTTLNTATLDIEDINITIANGATDSAAANGAGITVDGANATFTYNSSTDKWDFNKGIVAPTFTGTLTGTVSDISNHSTDDLSEGSNNLYYTTARSDSDFDTRLATKSTDNLTEGSSNLYYDSDRAAQAGLDALSVSDAGGDGSLAYNATTGTITYTGPSATEVRAHFSGGVGIDITNGVVSVDSSDITYFKTEILNALKLVDGATSGLDADLLDGQHGSYYRIDVYNSSGTLLN